MWKRHLLRRNGTQLSTTPHMHLLQDLWKLAPKFLERSTPGSGIDILLDFQVTLIVLKFNNQSRVCKQSAGKSIVVLVGIKGIGEADILAKTLSQLWNNVVDPQNIYKRNCVEMFVEHMFSWNVLLWVGDGIKRIIMWVNATLWDYHVPEYQRKHRPYSPEYYGSWERHYYFEKVLV